MAELKTYRDWIDNNIIYLRGEVEGDDGEESDSSGLRYTFRNVQLQQDNEELFKLNKKMLQLQSMLYVSSGTSQEWILDAYNELKGGRLSFEALRKIAIQRWAERRNSVDELIYSPGMDRLPFWILDYLLWEKVYEAQLQGGGGIISFCDDVKLELSKDQIDAIVSYRFTQNRSVEHLHPQNPPEESNAWEEDRKKGDIIRNSFGNLCMISQGANSSLSNDPVVVKFAKVKYALQGHPLQSIKLMLMFADCGGQKSEWTPERAIKHGSEMLQILGFDTNKIEEWKTHLRIASKGE